MFRAHFILTSPFKIQSNVTVEDIYDRFSDAAKQEATVTTRIWQISHFHQYKMRTRRSEIYVDEGVLYPFRQPYGAFTSGLDELRQSTIHWSLQPTELRLDIIETETR